MNAEMKNSYDLKQECEVMDSLRYENIGRLYGYIVNKSMTCLVMELAHRGSLYDVLHNFEKFPSLAWRQRLDIGLGIIRGLFYLHTLVPPIIHRDLKSLNVLIRQDWSVFLSDFGTAREANTKTQIAGTAAWMAPELSSMETPSQTTPAIDIFSFGMIMFEILTRGIPFQGKLPNQIILAIARGNRPVVPDEVAASAPKNYISLMERCWDQEGVKRPTAKQVLEEWKLLVSRS